ncbi:hypothetical protein FT688_03820 [Aeromonas hydrophila]|nr:hypothetical protein FT688_03820 [Aeromonas hydrophila]
MNDKIIQLKNLFLQSISLGASIDDKILEKTDDVLYFINDLDIDELRVSSAKLSHELHKLGSKSVPYLITLLLNKLEAVSYKPKFKAVKKQNNSIDSELFINFLERCYQCCNDEGVRILNFKTPQLNENDEVSVYCTTREMIDHIIETPLNLDELDKDLPTIIMALGISKELSHKYNCSHEFYIQFSSVLDRMNRDGLYQEARDYAEEALMCAHDSNELYYGHYVRYSIYTNQTNAIDSLINGCLLFTDLCNQDSICEEFIEHVYITTFMALRTFLFFDAAKLINKKYISTLHLSEYNQQKIDVAIFYMRVMESDSSLVRDIGSYISTKKNNILKFGNASLLPWFTLLCNLKTIFSKEFEGSYNVVEFERTVRQKLPDDIVNNIQAMVLKNNLGSKDLLIKGLVNLSRTRNKADFIHETNLLLVTAKRVIDTSLKNEDIEGVLLGHQLKSDGEVFFNGKALYTSNGTIHQTFNLEGENSARFRDYMKYVKEHLHDKRSQFLWIGINSDKIYYVIFDEGCFKYCSNVTSTNTEEIKKWVKNNLQDLAFNDSPVTGSPFITREDCWEQDKDKIIIGLPKFDIPISSSFNVVLFCDVEFSFFPHNLIKVEDKILGLRQAISSPLSFDNYLNYTNIKVCLDEIYLWAPIIEGDMAIAIAFSKLKEELNDINVLYDEGTIPNPRCDLNIFISHGGRDGNSGFCGLYPTSGKAYDVEGIFGTGKVAILFVCHSGSIVENIFSNSTHTLVKQLLQDGYDAVISPSWSLNVSIPGIWMRKFIGSMKTGKTISESVNKANLHVESVYISPGASAAMHLFGNDQIICG